MKADIYRFTPLDSLFFRESRPMESMGGSELSSLFPPPARTMAGALRTAVGDHNGVAWARYEKDPAFKELRDQIGVGEHPGAMRIHGPWLVKLEPGGPRRLYPAPCNLVAQMKGGRLHKILRLGVGPPHRCDLGDRVRLALPPDGSRGITGLSDYYVDGVTLGKILAGKTPGPEELIPLSELVAHEPRLGIARDNRSRTAETGLLYQTEHVRPAGDVVMEVAVSGIDPAFLPCKGIVRLGGEGRGAGFELITSGGEEVAAARVIENGRGLLLILLSHAQVEQDGRDFIPLPGFRRETRSGETVWRGEINRIPLTLHCAVWGKGVGEGGWDMVARRPRPVRSLVAAGAVFYCTVDDGDLSGALAKLHLQQLAANENDFALGRGLLAAGVWPENEFIDKETIS